MPFVMMVCDEMDAYDYGMPSQDMIGQMTDQISQDVLRIHPDVAEQANFYEMSYEAASAYNIPSSVVEAQQFGGRFFNDLVTIVLLDEIFRRRRRF
jgi:hypothetical protein